MVNVLIVERIVAMRVHPLKRGLADLSRNSTSIGRWIIQELRLMQGLKNNPA